mmetsp:Transcript_7033/g.16372  ORF Transcript_7033/g.16372 Transcript_7033/m.16372 type:complete len:301 (+) Transcript_7033:668-1570(+)
MLMGSYEPFMVVCFGPTFCDWPAYGSFKHWCPLPSLIIWKPRMPASSSVSTAVSTIAPAPSPKRTHELRSDQSTHRESASAPITIAFLYPPPLRYCPAVTVANRKPEHAAVRSNATASLAPIMLATYGASPNMSSGELVATTTRSMSAALRPESSSACIAALTSRSLNVSVPSRQWRDPMPVRVMIHSSVVSTMSSMSLLLMMGVGAAFPMPIGLAISLLRLIFLTGASATSDCAMVHDSFPRVREEASGSTGLSVPNRPCWPAAEKVRGARERPAGLHANETWMQENRMAATNFILVSP